MIDFKKYPGAKTGSGMIQFLINHIPHHTRYFELFAGTAALYLAKKPAAIKNVLTDIDIRVVKRQWARADAKCDVYRFSALEL